MTARMFYDEMKVTDGFLPPLLLEYLESLSQRELRQFIKVCTGSSLVPFGGFNARRDKESTWVRRARVLDVGDNPPHIFMPDYETIDELKHAFEEWFSQAKADYVDWANHIKNVSDFSLLRARRESLASMDRGLHVEFVDEDHLANFHEEEEEEEE